MANEEFFYIAPDEDIAVEDGCVQIGDAARVELRRMNRERLLRVTDAGSIQ